MPKDKIYTDAELAGMLHRAGVRPSAQRISIFSFVANSQRHPAAESIFTALSEKYPSLSRTTVYNSLHTLVDAGLVGICVTILRRKVRTAILYAVRADAYSTCRCPQMSKDSFRPDLPRKVSTSISGAYALNVAVQMAEAAVIRSIIHQHKKN